MGEAAENRLALWLLTAYGLYGLGIFTFGVSAILGVLLAYLKRRACAPSRLLAAHTRHLIATFWIGTLLGLATAAAPLATGWALSALGNTGDAAGWAVVGLGAGGLIVKGFVILWMVWRGLYGFVRLGNGQEP